MDRLPSILQQATDLEEKIQNIKTIFDQLTKNGQNVTNPEVIVQLKLLINRLMNDDVLIQISKTVLLHFVTTFRSTEYELFEGILNHLLECIKKTPNNYDEIDYCAREKLFAFYIGCQQYSEGAQALASLNLESTVRPYTNFEKADVYIKCAEAYLQDDASVEAEVFLNKVSPLMNSIDSTEHWLLHMRYKLTFARVQDSNRKFLEAASRYYELSTTSNQLIPAEELLELLAKAVTCAILSKAGQQRTRILGVLSKDERLSQLEGMNNYNSHVTLLRKIQREQIVTRDELRAFEGQLADHQKALTSDHCTILERAMLEHNMFATSKLYVSITLSGLSNILQVDAIRAERIAASMINEGRLKATIDQVDNFVDFEHHQQQHPQDRFNDSVTELCKDISDFTEQAKPLIATVTK